MADTGPDETHLLQVIGGLAAELQRGRSRRPVTLDSALDKDLGFDSLSRVELIARLETAFNVALPDQVFATAETPRDLLRAVAGAGARSAASVPARRAEAASTGPSELPIEAETLLDVLEWHARDTDRIYVRFHSDDGDGEILTYAGLASQAAGVAAALQARGLEPGQSVGLMLATGPDYFRGFFGILMAGGVPVPLYPPARPTQIEEHLKRQGAILDNALAAMLITVPEAKAVARLLKGGVQSLKAVVTPEDLEGGNSAELQRPVIRSGDTAFLQYTSGSTGTPKGVVLSHANLLANVRAMGQALDAPRPGDVFVSWLPLYHDMGLIGACLGTLYFGIPLVLMSPLNFLARPERWLQAIHRWRGTISAAPNFAYELCLRRVSDDVLAELDLSSWRAAANGAEAVSPETIARFAERFAPAGLRRESVMPVYGLAECSVGLAFPPLGRGPLIDTVDRDALARKGVAQPTEDGATLRVVACGQPLPGHQIRIVDKKGRELPERQEGRLQFRGPSATSGYLRNPEATKALFDGDWLDSGDLAYMAGGDVFITGRAKDVIIRGGRNIYPAELEEMVSGLEGVRAGNVAVFGGADPETGTERLIVLAESRKRDEADREALRARITEVSVDLTGMPPDEVVLAPPNTVLKTSSGKVRRAATRRIWEKGLVGKPRRSLRWQVARLALAGLGPRLRTGLGNVGFVLRAGRAWAVAGLFALPLWLAAVVPPGSGVRWALVRGVLRLGAALAGVRISVQGLEALPDRPVVLVANHMSYLDAFVLTAALPRPLVFVAKAELAASPLIRIPFARLGIAYVERFDRGRGTEDALALTETARSGRSLLFFPEGTFTRMPGLLPFYMGGFQVAVEAGLPVVPVTLRGTRSVLRAGSWFPRPGRVSVTLAPPLAPDGQGWDAALALRDGARAAILARSGEPDLAHERAEIFDKEG